MKGRVKMKLRIAGITDDSVVDGDGYRFTIFTQGCHHHCSGCHNPQTWTMEGGHDADTDELLKDILKNPLLAGATFSGGEPFLQAKPLSILARKLHEQKKNVWCYSGWTYEELSSNPDTDIQDLLAEIDVLVDGPFIADQKDLTLHFRGSRNQRVIDMKKTRGTGHVVLKYTD